VYLLVCGDLLRLFVSDDYFGNRLPGSGSLGLELIPATHGSQGIVLYSDCGEGGDWTPRGSG